MKKKMFFFLIAIMSLSLIGIIFVQGYWINQAVDANEEQFSFNAKQSLIKVADQVQDKELEKYYVQYASISDSIKPGKARLSQIFQIKRNKFTNETFFYTNSLLQEDYKVRSKIPGSEQDSINFKKLINRKVTRVIRGDNIDGNLSMSAQEKFERVSHMKSSEKKWLLDAIKDQTAKEPIFKRVTKTELRKLIDKQLKMLDIKSDYNFGIYSNGMATKVMSGNFSPSSKASYGISVFPSELTNYKLFIHFTGRKKEILSSIFWMAALSVIFTFIIVIAYSSAIFQLIKQRRISQIKTDFINNMTHEFKTPIATINLALDSVKNPKINSDPEKVKHYMKMIRDENKRMHAQVENVLRISKFERNELNLKKECLSLHDLLEEAITHVSLIAENRQGYIKKHFDASKASILANDSHFVNVLVNILDNAIKYSEESPKIDIYTENVKNYVVVKVSDQGKGMSKTAQKKVFEKFFREHTGDVHNVKGHGLGLAYAKKIVEDHQGEISLESEKGKGSTFIIKLPLIS